MNVNTNSESSLRIGLIGHSLSVAGGVMVRRGIMRTLARIAPSHQYFMTVPSDDIDPELADMANVTLLPIPRMPYWKRIAWEQTRLPETLRGYGCNWIWSLGNYGLICPPCRQSLLIQDPHLVYPPKDYSYESWKYRMVKRVIRLMLRCSLQKVSRVYCQTEVISARFCQKYRYASSRVGLCPAAVDSFQASGVQELPEVLRPYKHKFKLFFLAKCYGHKNHKRTIEAYQRYGNELEDTVCIFTISADQHPIAPELMATIELPEYKGKIVNVGPLTREQVAQYFQHCDAFVMPSLLETFGIPYLEAMHFGKPILAADRDFSHSVCGDAALYVDPLSVESIKNGIIALRDNAEMRERLIQSGYERMSQHFRSWEQILCRVLTDEKISLG